MRHPLRNLAEQGFWYTLANVLFKLAGVVLLPLYTNTQFLSVEAFGVWGVFEITVSIAVAVIGLQLGAGLVRFYPDHPEPARVASTVWWVTVVSTALSATAGIFLVRFLAPEDAHRAYLLLVAYIAGELLLAVPLSLLRARGKAAAFLGLSVVKLALAVGLNVYWLKVSALGLVGVVQSFAVAAWITLGAGWLLTGPRLYVGVRPRRELARSLLRFSVPLIVGGLGSMLLNAGDRYILALYRSEEDIALYTLAAKFGSVIFMFGVQPLQLALLPVLFRLAESQRSEVLSLLMRYLVVGFGALVVGVSVFSEPVLDLFGADAFYQQSIILIPWIAFGFALFGLSVLSDGVLYMVHRTRTVTVWMTAAAAVNLGLNFLAVPRLGPLGAAVTTFASYLLLFAGRRWSASASLFVPYEWPSLAGIGFVTAAASGAGVLIALPAGAAGLSLRAAIVLAWAALILLFGWFRLADARTALLHLRGAGER